MKSIKEIMNTYFNYNEGEGFVDLEKELAMDLPKCKWCGDPVLPRASKFGMHTSCHREAKAEHDGLEKYEKRKHENLVQQTKDG